MAIEEKRHLGLPPGVGLVLAMTHGGVEMIDGEKRFLFGTISGGARYRQTRKRLLVVGDRVTFFEKSGEVIINERLERKSELTRFDDRGNEHVIAANMDAVLIVVSWDLPPLKLGLIDRYILASKLGKLRPVVVVNKIDLVKDSKGIDKIASMYRGLGFSFWLTSAIGNPCGIEELRKDLTDQWVIFSGQSGVGKTALASALTGVQGLKMGEILKETGKGRHTTSFTRVFPLPNGGALVDSPGIRSFGLSQLQKDQVILGFPEIEKFSSKCGFRNCTHLVEQGCVVRSSIGEPDGITPSRYESYSRIISELKQTPYLRPDYPKK
ncbi:ribosome small subunit-dependent GTPase A [bacterium]|nr:ribosome small subunit-dependent GTPase A [bacterium]